MYDAPVHPSCLVMTDMLSKHAPTIGSKAEECSVPMDPSSSYGFS